MIIILISQLVPNCEYLSNRFGVAYHVDCHESTKQESRQNIIPVMHVISYSGQSKE